MKKTLAVTLLLSALMCGTVFAEAKKEEPVNEYDVIIDDEADLLTAEEEADLLEDMLPLREFGNVIFWTTDGAEGSAEEEAKEYLNENVSKDVRESSAIFLTDMEERIMWIQSRGEFYDTITEEDAEEITSDVSHYASQKDYYTCAKECYSRILDLMEEEFETETEVDTDQKTD